MIEIWDNPVSRRLEKKGKNTEALLFRIMNLSGRISLVFLVFGVLQCVPVVKMLVANPFSALQILPTYAILCYFLSSCAYAVFAWATAGVAYLRKDYWWAAGIIVLNILSLPYIWGETRKMR